LAIIGPKKVTVCHSPTLKRYIIPSDVSFFQFVQYFESTYLVPKPLPVVIPSPPAIVQLETPTVDRPASQPLKTYHRHQPLFFEHVPTPTPVTEIIPYC
jgi:hypothetical protein